MMCDISHHWLSWRSGDHQRQDRRSWSDQLLLANQYAIIKQALRGILIGLVFFLSPQWLTAAHLKGGYIEYKYLGPSPTTPGFKTYEISVYQYLDCSSAGGQIDDQIIVGTFDATTNQHISTSYIALGPTKNIAKTKFDCIINPPVVCYRIDSYNFVLEIPDSPNGVILCVERCCRIAGINNVFNSSNTGVTYMVKIFPSLSGNGLVVNSSPVFAQEDTALVCAQNGFTFPFKATDADGDSLAFKFTPGLNSPTREAKPNPPIAPPFPLLDYSASFTADQPLGDKVTIDPHTGIISGIAPAAAGDYVVAVMVEEYRNGVKIAETRKELHLSVGNCNIPRAILPSGIVNCKDFSVDFENQSNSSGINSYYWDFGVPNSTTDVSTSPTPTFTYPDTGVYRVKLVVNRNELCPDSIETEAKIFPDFTADFSFTSVCRQLPYEFRDQSVTTNGTVAKWRWDFGVPGLSNDTSVLKNPSFAYNDSGTYQVKLVASSSKGCVDSVTKQIDVTDKPNIELAFRDTTICRTDTLQLMTLTPGNYVWTPAVNIINATSGSPLVYPPISTTYRVTLTNRGCTGLDSVRVNVVNFITVDAGNDTTVCRGDAITLRPVSLGNRYTWSPARYVTDPTVKNALAIVPDSIATLRVFTTLGKCTATDSLTVRTEPYPIVNAGVDTFICFGSPVTLRGSGNAADFTWSPAGGVENTRSLTTRAFPQVSGYFVLTGSNNAGCTKPVTDTVLVSVGPQITVFAGSDTSAVVEQPIQLNGVTNGTIYSWSPATGISNPDILNPVLTISAENAAGAGEYLNYRLTATSNGCSASDVLVIRLFKTQPSIFVPSGFTPNGDGLNDIIRPVLAGIQQLDYFRIYNRYGTLIYETKRPGAGWDGRIKGQLQQSNSFVYDCAATEYTGKKIRAKGTFTLLR